MLFAGYRIPHPLENKVEVKIHTDGQITPHEALFESIDLIKNEMTTLQTQFVVINIYIYIYIECC